MSTSISPSQLAGILQLAINMRPDVQRVTVKADEHNKNLLVVDVRYYTSGRRVQRSASIAKILEPQESTGKARTIGTILKEWLGPMPRLPKGESGAMKRERIDVLLSTAEEVLHKRRFLRTVQPPKKPTSKFDWSQSSPPQADQTPDGALSKGPSDPVAAPKPKPPAAVKKAKTTKKKAPRRKKKS